MLLSYQTYTNEHPQVLPSGGLKSCTELPTMQYYSKLIHTGTPPLFGPLCEDRQLGKWFIGKWNKAREVVHWQMEQGNPEHYYW